MGEPVRIAAAAGVLAAALVGLVAREGQARATGLEVALPMAGVDPRGLLTGHYAELELQQALPPGEPCPPGTDDDAATGLFGDAPRGWVALRQAGGEWRTAGMARERAEAERLGPVVLRGLASCRPVLGSATVELDIGISRFHADQGEAEAMERLLRGSRPGEAPRAYALVSVGRDGRARLKGVRIDGRRIELEWF